jgi:hypothetical protein
MTEWTQRSIDAAMNLFRNFMEDAQTRIAELEAKVERLEARQRWEDDYARDQAERT